MRLKNLSLINFRNYEKATIEFSKGINILVGDNGSGKTNILEGIYVLSLTKSNRYGKDLDLINVNANNMSLCGEVEYGDYLKKYQILMDKFSKKVYINNFQVKKIADYVSNFCITSFLPNDIEIIKGPPNIRRNLLNIQIGQLYNHYLKYVNEYNSILHIRNDYLKRLYINSFLDVKYLEVINKKLLDISLKIYYFRFFYILNINKILPNIYKKLSGKSSLKIEYSNNLGLDIYDEEVIKEQLMLKWQKNLNKEMQQGMTLTGLHRDDIIFLVDSKDARTFASQGQQRLIVIAYKIAELLVFKKIKGEYPVLLLDDVFSEIDIKRRNNIIKYLKQDMQVIITTTDIYNLDSDLVASARVFAIKNGKINKKGGVKNARRKS